MGPWSWRRTTALSNLIRCVKLSPAFDIPVAPHYNWDVHTQLMATIPNPLFVEYFVKESGVKMFDEVLENPMHAEGGFIEPRTDPGFGWRFRTDKLAALRIG